MLTNGYKGSLFLVYHDQKSSPGQGDILENECNFGRVFWTLSAKITVQSLLFASPKSTDSRKPVKVPFRVKFSTVGAHVSVEVVFTGDPTSLACDIILDV